MMFGFLTEPEIIRELRMPERVGRAMLEMWKLSPSFPKPIDGAGGRRWFPEVIQWLNRLYNVAPANEQFSLIAEGEENFDEWRKTRKTRQPRVSGPNLSPQQQGVGTVVAAQARFERPRLSKDAVPPMASEREPEPAT